MSEHGFMRRTSRYGNQSSGLMSMRTEPTRDELRAMLADAARRTAAIPVDHTAPLPPYAHDKTRSEHAGSSQ